MCQLLFIFHKVFINFCNNNHVFKLNFELNKTDCLITKRAEEHKYVNNV